MHEFSVINNLLKIVDKICKENNAKKGLKINLKINP
jgi:Zn finger protein HypA/HybF involved in hydrogenase expression